jgi:predicted MPP superfamily phosphohydrolase
VNIRIFFTVPSIALANTGFFANPDTLSFFHKTVIHLIFQFETYLKDLAKNREHYGEGIAPFLDFLKRNNKENNADFIVATGDLIDFYKGKTEDEGMLGKRIKPCEKKYLFLFPEAKKKRQKSAFKTTCIPAK